MVIEPRIVLLEDRARIGQGDREAAQRRLEHARQRLAFRPDCRVKLEQALRQTLALGWQLEIRLVLEVQLVDHGARGQIERYHGAVHVTVQDRRRQTIVAQPLELADVGRVVPVAPCRVGGEQRVEAAALDVQHQHLRVLELLLDQDLRERQPPAAGREGGMDKVARLQ